MSRQRPKGLSQANLSKMKNSGEKVIREESSPGEVAFPEKIAVRSEENRHSSFEAKKAGESEGGIVLNIEPVSNTGRASISIKKLRAGNQILVKISDQRDIGRYLCRLLGGYWGDAVIPLPTTVEKIEDMGGSWAIRTKFTSRIFGEAIVEKTKLTRVARPEKVVQKIRIRDLLVAVVLLLLLLGIIWLVLG